MPRSKNESKPRGRMTSYAYFVQTCREEHKKKHPDENVVFSEFSRKCAERWKVILLRIKAGARSVTSYNDLIVNRN